jgi:ribosomal protein S14
MTDDTLTQKKKREKTKEKKEKRCVETGQSVSVKKKTNK